MLERAHVPVEEADLILPPVEPREVSPRVHQAQQEHPRLLPLAHDVDEDLEEVDFGEVARLVRQRHEHLAPLPLPFGDERAHRPLADEMALADKDLVQPHRREPLLPPVQCFESSSSSSTRDRTRSFTGDGLGASFRDTGLRTRHVPPHRVPRDAQLLGDPLHRPALDEHLVPHNVNLVHRQHPFQRTPGP